MTFLPASEAHARATDGLVVLNEITAIENAILLSVTTGKLDVSVSGTTLTDPMTPDPMTITLSMKYWQVWRNEIQDPVLEEHMNLVITNFTDLGYSVVRLTDSTLTTVTHAKPVFSWKISW